jgi:LPS sulfotransferase NodH
MLVGSSLSLPPFIYLFFLLQSRSSLRSVATGPRVGPMYCGLIPSEERHLSRLLSVQAGSGSQPPTQRVLRAPNPAVRWLGSETGRLFPSSAEAGVPSAIAFVCIHKGSGPDSIWGMKGNKIRFIILCLEAFFLKGRACNSQTRSFAVLFEFGSWFVTLRK